VAAAVVVVAASVVVCGRRKVSERGPSRGIPIRGEVINGSQTLPLVKGEVHFKTHESLGKNKDLAMDRLTVLAKPISNLSGQLDRAETSSKTVIGLYGPWVAKPRITVLERVSSNLR
jgi:hypothetical protein